MVRVISKCEGKNYFFNHAVYQDPMSIFFDFHTHTTCEIIFLKSGALSCIVGEKIYSLKKNDLMIFRANIPHKITFIENTEYERYNILFDEKKMANKVFFKLPKELNVISCDGDTRLIDLFEKMDLYCKKLDKKDAAVAVGNIVEEILFNIYLTPFDDMSRERATTHPIISSAIEYINAHYKEPITVSDVSEHLFVTKSHLHHLFMQTMQISPKRYINLKRISKARQLILLGEKPYDVYICCGFKDYTTFFRNYTMIFEHSPSEESGVVTEESIKS